MIMSMTKCFEHLFTDLSVNNFHHVNLCGSFCLLFIFASLSPLSTHFSVCLSMLYALCSMYSIDSITLINVFFISISQRTSILEQKCEFFFKQNPVFGRNFQSGKTWQQHSKIIRAVQPIN